MSGGRGKYLTSHFRYEHELDPTKRKVCNGCKIEKAHTEFYATSGNRSRPLSECIECMKERDRTHEPYDPYASRNPSERNIMRILGSLGVPSVPGKTLGVDHCDVLAWGCVPIEVKSSAQNKNGSFAFKFSMRQRNGVLRGRVIVLVCRHEEADDTYHVFPALQDVFWKDGKLKSAVMYTPDADHSHMTAEKRLLTDAMMADAQDNWDLIEIERVKVSREIAQRAHEVERPSDIYLLGL